MLDAIAGRTIGFDAPLLYRNLSLSLIIPARERTNVSRICVHKYYFPIHAFSTFRFPWISLPPQAPYAIQSKFVATTVFVHQRFNFYSPYPPNLGKTTTVLRVTPPLLLSPVPSTHGTPPFSANNATAGYEWSVYIIGFRSTNNGDSVVVVVGYVWNNRHTFSGGSRLHGIWLCESALCCCN